MPCFYDYPEESSRQQQVQLDKLTRLLCEACGLLGNFAKPEMSLELKVWWSEHQAKDAARRAREEQVVAAEQLRERARGKLTEEERHALGIFQ